MGHASPAWGLSLNPTMAVDQLEIEKLWNMKQGFILFGGRLLTLIVQWEATKKRRKTTTLLLSGHCDTVPGSAREITSRPQMSSTRTASISPTFMRWRLRSHTKYRNAFWSFPDTLQDGPLRTYFSFGSVSAHSQPNSGPWTGSWMVHIFSKLLIS